MKGMKMHREESSIRHAATGSGRSSRWLWTTLLVLALVAVAGAAYWLVANWLASREATPAPTITVTITAPPPTPTISPSPRESGTDFYNAIPSTIGAYVLVATEPGPDFEAAGAYDSYILTYSDGAHTVTVLAGQWRSEAAATDAFNAMGGPEGWPGADVDLTSTVCPDPPTPDTAALWRNVTAIFEVRAPDGGATEFFCRMPM